MKHVDRIATALAVLLLATLARPLLALAQWVVELAAYLERRPSVVPRALALLAVPVLVTTCYLAFTAVRGGGHGIGRPAVVTHAAPPPIRVRWLARAGAFRVERVWAPQTHLAVDLRRPPAGIGHTTECSFECALRVFRRHYAPTFLVGRDARGRVRIVQFVPLGEAAGTMRNLSGGVETNRWARAQVELAARSRASAWTADAGTMHAFEALLATLRADAGIPLTRPFGDSWSAAADASRRASGSWGRVGGWFNHGEVPENNHWDMGAFRWRSALAAARGARLAPGPLAAAPARGRAAGAG